MFVRDLIIRLIIYETLSRVHLSKAIFVESKSSEYVQLALGLLRQDAPFHLWVIVSYISSFLDGSLVESHAIVQSTHFFK